MNFEGSLKTDRPSRYTFSRFSIFVPNSSPLCEPEKPRCCKKKKRTLSKSNTELLFLSTYKMVIFPLYRYQMFLTLTVIIEMGFRLDRCALIENASDRHRASKIILGQKLKKGTLRVYTCKAKRL